MNSYRHLFIKRSASPTCGKKTKSAIPKLLLLIHSSFCIAKPSSLRGVQVIQGIQRRDYLRLDTVHREVGSENVLSQPSIGQKPFEIRRSFTSSEPHRLDNIFNHTTSFHTDDLNVVFSKNENAEYDNLPHDGNGNTVQQDQNSSMKSSHMTSVILTVVASSILFCVLFLFIVEQRDRYLLYKLKCRHRIIEDHLQDDHSSDKSMIIHEWEEDEDDGSSSEENSKGSSVSIL